MSRLLLYKKGADFCADRANHTLQHYWKTKDDWRKLEDSWEFLIKLEATLDGVLIGSAPKRYSTLDAK